VKLPGSAGRSVDEHYFRRGRGGFRQFVVADLCDPYKTFAHRFFPNARIVADKFHVLRLLAPHSNRRRKLVTGDRRSALIRRLLLRSRFALDHTSRWAVDRWLESYPELRAVYTAKEALHSLYRIRGIARAAAAFTALTDQLASSPLPELQTFRRTLLRWRPEILAYFGTGLTNARTEGFNNKAKLVKSALTAIGASATTDSDS
jgi:transposase